MVKKRQGRVEKLESEFFRVGLPFGRPGNARDNGELLTAKTGTVRSWLAEDRRIPDYPFAILKLWGMLSTEQQAEYRRWASECADRGDYAPED